MGRGVSYCGLEIHCRCVAADLSMFWAGRVWFAPLVRDVALIIEVGDSYVDGIH